ncbi:MAG: sodium/proline symporter [Alphaproteobacteria bacterium]|nr:sodium/proline symporter [Alphaproteobacteria bacterium]
MEAFREPIILGSVAFYMALCIGIGVWAMRRTRSANDFFVAGRSLGPLIVGLAVFSSTLSGFGFVGGPGLVYSLGMSSVWMVNISAFGYAIGFFLVAKRIRMIAELRDTISLPDVLAARYDSEFVRLLTGVTIVLGVLGYLATQVLAMATVLQSILSGTQAFAGIDFVTCAALSSAVLIFYSVTGGIIAGVYTDVVQGLIMMAAGILVVVTAATAIPAFPGGFADATATILADDAEAAMPWGTVGIMGCIAWFFVFGIGLAGQPHLVTKMMMNRRLSDNRVVLPLAMLGYAVAALLWISIGVVMRGVVVGGDAAPLDMPDSAAPAFLSAFAHPLLAGVVFAGLFAAIMSTADSFLNIGAAALIHDIPRAIRGRSLGNELFWARVATVAIAVLSFAFALYSHFANGRLVALLGAFGWGTFAAALVPVVMFGLNWKRASRAGAVAAILVSLVVNFAVELFHIALPYGINGGYVAFGLAMLAFVGFSLVLKPRPVASDIARVMEL